MQSIQLSLAQPESSHPPERMLAEPYFGRHSMAWDDRVYVGNTWYESAYIVISALKVKAHCKACGGAVRHQAAHELEPDSTCRDRPLLHLDP